MKKYFPAFYFIITATFFCISTILDVKSSIQGFSFVLLSSAGGILIGNYLRLREKISLTKMDKLMIIALLLLSISLCCIFLVFIGNLLWKQVSICSLLLITAIISISIVFRKNKNVEKI